MTDSAACSQRNSARSRICAAGSFGAAAKSKAYGPREVLIRINGLDTEWGADDLKAVAQSGADGVLVPKVDAPADIQKVAGILDLLL